LQPGGQDTAGRTDWDYDVIEYVPAAALPADHFTTLPPEADRLKDISGVWYMTPEEAAAFDGFPIYWLGTEYDGLPLGSTGIQANYSAPTADQLFDRPGTRDVHSVDVNYSNLYTPATSRPPGTIQLLQEPVGQALRREGADYAPRQDAAAVRVGEAVVSFCCEEGAARAQLGNTMIRLYGGSADELKEVVAALRPLNQPAQ
jgi:hypothetical protein